MKPMIFFDVDGTLMDNHDYQVTPSTKKALQKLQENGYKIGIATGSTRFKNGASNHYPRAR